MMNRLKTGVWIAGLLCAANMGLAQSQPGTPVPRFPPPAIDPATGQPVALKTKPEPPRFDLDFSGGEPKDMLEAMAAHGVRPNIVIHPDCKNGMIPPIKLRDVTAAQVFNAINTLREPDYQDGKFYLVPQQDGELWALTPVPPKKDPAAAFQQQMSALTSAPQASVRACKVFNLTPILDDYTIDDVTTAIKGAWDLLGSRIAPDLKFHKDTKLLIVVGENGHLGVVQDVIRELTMNVQMKRGGPPAGAGEKSKVAAPKPVPEGAPTTAGSKP